MKILIMDDERPALNLLRDILKKICDKSTEIVPLRTIKEYYDYDDKTSFDVAFIDIELGSKSGIDIAFDIKNKSPMCNIIFVTSYAKYGTDAYKVRPSGYVLKPYTEDEIREELSNLRYPIDENHNKSLKVVTFGSFVVYKEDGSVFNFSRTVAKEVFAYLIDCAGMPVTTSEIAEDILEKHLDKQVSKNLSKVIKSLMDDLAREGYPDVVIKQNRQLQINKNRVKCDLYDALRGDANAINSYKGEYMIDYSWAEVSDAAHRIHGER